MILRPFLLCRTECTQAVWDRIGGEDDRRFNGPSLPIESVTWNEVQAWLKKTGFRLPTEAEWEYACRAGTRTPYANGETDADLGAMAWYRTNSLDRTHAVKRLAMNAFGLFDMHGNVWEWCQDRYRSDYDRAPRDGSAYVAEDAADRVVRGGSWFSYAANCRSARRLAVPPETRKPYIGFRPAVSIP